MGGCAVLASGWAAHLERHHDGRHGQLPAGLAQHCGQLQFAVDHTSMHSGKGLGTLINPCGAHATHRWWWPLAVPKQQTPHEDRLCTAPPQPAVQCIKQRISREGGLGSIVHL